LRLQLKAHASWLLCVLAVWPASAHAYSSFGDYARPVAEGGGGGKFFTGTPLDGYTCDVCHSGGAATKLEVVGLPTAGYVPGQSYQIAFQWPAPALDAAPKSALMVELTDTIGAPAGTPALVPYVQWTEAEKCALDDFPAADICRAGAEPGCCRDLDPTRDGCSFPGERSMLWMLECGARSARFNWTAPVDGVDVWFSASMVTSNAGNDAAGDGVTLVRQRLYPASGSTTRAGAVGSCQLQRGRPASSRPAVAALLCALICAVGRSGKRRRSRATSTTRLHT
jgi:hypothetical protein